MALPTVTVAPTSGPAGTVVTVTVVRDVAPIPETITVTTPGGSGSASFNVIEALAVAVSPARTLTVVSDNGTTYVGTFVA
jgi:hypothetical protein